MIPAQNPDLVRQQILIVSDRLSNPAGAESAQASQGFPRIQGVGVVATQNPDLVRQQTFKIADRTSDVTGPGATKCIDPALLIGTHLRC